MSKTKSILLTAGIGLFLLLPAVIAEESPAAPADGANVENEVRDLRAKAGELLAAGPAARWRPALERRAAVLSEFKPGWAGGASGTLYLKQTRELLEDLAAGRAPFTRSAGRHIWFVYRSDATRNLEGVQLVVPAAYDGSREYQAFVYYKLGGGNYWTIGEKYVPWKTPGAVPHNYLPKVATCLKLKDTFNLWSTLDCQLKGRMGQAEEFEAVTENVSRDFSVSPDRWFPTGFSDGGFDALFLAIHYPHLVAGTMPEVANWQYSNSGYLNLLNTPLLHVDALSNAGYIQENLNRLLVLWDRKYDAEGLFNVHGHQDFPYKAENADSLLAMEEWAKSRRRDPWPRHVRYSTWSLRWPRAYWVTIERMESHFYISTIDITAKADNLLEATAVNVAAFSLRPGGNLIDRSRPVRVMVNGKEAWNGPAGEEIRIVLRPDAGPLVRSPETPGGITEALERGLYESRPLPGMGWTTVRPTSDPALAERLAPFLPKEAVDDAAVDEALLRKHDLLVVGGPRANALLARVADRLPVRFGKGSFSIGGRVFDRPQAGLRFVTANPLNPGKHLLVLAWNDWEAFAASSFGGMGRGFFSPSVYAMRDGDCQVLGSGLEGVLPFSVRTAVTRNRQPVEQFLWDSGFNPPSTASIGEFTAPFDGLAVRHLCAEAARAAAGADAGLSHAFPEHQILGRHVFAAGPVTENDIATIPGVPEFVMLAEMTGAQLRQWHHASVASTIFASREEPGFQPGKSLALPDIEDARTYRVAFDYMRAVTWTVSNEAMKSFPRNLRLRSPADFGAMPGFALNLLSLRQTDIDLAAALTAHVRRAGRLAPRVWSGDLARYLANPEVNEFPACDWVHFALSDPDPAATGPAARPGRLSVALSVPGADARRARPDSKAFVRLTADGGRADFSALAGRLPAAATVTGGNLTLPVGVQGGALRLVLRLENSGKAALRGRVALSGPDVGNPRPGSFIQSGSGWRGIVDAQKQGVREKARIQAAEGAVFTGLPEATTFEVPVIPGCGYGRGGVAMVMDIEVPAGGAVEIPLVVFRARAAGKQGVGLDLDALVTAARPRGADRGEGNRPPDRPSMFQTPLSNEKQ